MEDIAMEAGANAAKGDFAKAKQLDAALAARADRVVTLRDGRVVSDEATDGRPA
jgi:hypothetical protein